jgi:hypothetical protein
MKIFIIYVLDTDGPLGLHDLDFKYSKANEN